MITDANDNPPFILINDEARMGFVTLTIEQRVREFCHGKK